MIPTLEIDEPRKGPGDSDMRGRAEEVAGFKWRKASSVPGGRSLAFLFGVAVTAIAAFYGQDNLKIFVNTKSAPTVLAEKPGQSGKTAAAVQNTATAKPVTVGGALAAPAAAAVAGPDKDTTAIFADPKPEPAKTPEPAQGSAAKPSPSAAAVPAPSGIQPKPAVINRDAGATEPKLDARPVEKPASKQLERSAEDKTLQPPSTYPPNRYEAGRPAPRMRPEPARGPRVDPNGRDTGYWNGSDFN